MLRVRRVVAWLIDTAPLWLAALLAFTSACSGSNAGMKPDGAAGTSDTGGTGPCSGSCGGVLPPPRNGGWCIQASPGDYSYSYFATYNVLPQ